MATAWTRSWRWRTRNSARRGRKYLKKCIHKRLRFEAKLAALDEEFVPTLHIYNDWEVI